MQIEWTIDGIDLKIRISNIQWDNDSIGMTEAWGFLKDDDRDDYISDFDVDEILFVGDEEKHKFHEQCETIANHRWLQDADFVAKVEDVERYG